MLILLIQKTTNGERGSQNSQFWDNIVYGLLLNEDLISMCLDSMSRFFGPVRDTSGFQNLFCFWSSVCFFGTLEYVGYSPKFPYGLRPLPVDELKNAFDVY